MLVFFAYMSTSHQHHSFAGEIEMESSFLFCIRRGNGDYRLEVVYVRKNKRGRSLRGMRAGEGNVDDEERKKEEDTKTAIFENEFNEKLLSSLLQAIKSPVCKQIRLPQAPEEQTFFFSLRWNSPYSSSSFSSDEFVFKRKLFSLTQ